MLLRLKRRNSSGHFAEDRKEAVWKLCANLSRLFDFCSYTLKQNKLFALPIVRVAFQGIVSKTKMMHTFLEKKKNVPVKVNLNHLRIKLTLFQCNHSRKTIQIKNHTRSISRAIKVQQWAVDRDANLNCSSDKLHHALGKTYRLF